jgi:hypothetical protein
VGREGRQKGGGRETYSQSIRRLLPAHRSRPRSRQTLDLIFTTGSETSISLCLLNMRETEKANRDAPISTTTKHPSSSTISVTCANSRCTSFPDSENHFEKSECELISIKRPDW